MDKNITKPWIADIRIGAIALYQGEHQNCLSTGEKIAYWEGFKDENGDWQVHHYDAEMAKRIAEYANATINELKRQRDGLAAVLKDILSVTTEKNIVKVQKIIEEIKKENG
jgi:hypothetical protein